MKKALFYVIFILLQVLLVEVALQAYYRVSNGEWLNRRVALPIYEQDPVRVYRAKANLEYAHVTNEFRVNYYTDNLGLRAAAPGKVTTVAKAAKTYRILFLGPSFSFGMASQFADMYVTRIAEQLQVAGKQIEVINLGTPSQPMRWQQCWVKYVAPQFGIDLVVQTVYGFSILTEPDCDKEPPLPFVKDDYLYSSNPSLTRRAAKFMKKSAVVFYSWYLYQSILQPEEMKRGLGTELYQQVASGEAATRHGKGYYKRLAVEGYSAYLQNIRAWLGDTPKVVILHLPYSYIVHPEDIARFGDPEYVPDANEVLIKALAMAEALAELGLPFVDTTPALLEQSSAERQYNFIDVHFTTAGNRTVADYAAPAIQQVIDSP